MFAADLPTVSAPVTLPSWVERVALPHYPAMPLAGYVMLGLGALVLLIGYFAPIKKFPALLTGMALLAYYPLAYLFFWLLLRFNQEIQPAREPSKFEVFLRERLHTFSWVILGLCIVLSLLFFVWTVMGTIRKGRRSRKRETAKVDNPFGPQPAAVPQPSPAGPAVPRPAAPRPAPPVPQARHAPKKPSAPPAGDNPFNFG
jgi:predicted lysophospholipase L1 biosynthesis ABC-type transport system permease subunit